jgi:hypothetical protein
MRFSTDDGLFENSLARPTLAQTAGNRSAHTQNCRARILSKNYTVDFEFDPDTGGHVPTLRLPAHIALTLPPWRSQADAETHISQGQAIDIIGSLSNRILAHH